LVGAELGGEPERDAKRETSFIGTFLTQDAPEGAPGEALAADRAGLGSFAGLRRPSVIAGIKRTSTIAITELVMEPRHACPYGCSR